MALLVTLSVADSEPTSEGVNVIGIEQVLTTVPVHVFVPITKSAALVPVTVTLLKVMDPPLVVPVTISNTGELTGKLPNARLVGLSESDSVACPVPVAAMVMGLPVMELASESVPV